MSQFEHRFQIVVAAAPAEVHALLSDPEVLPELHPLIERVWITERTRTADGELLRFGLFERIPLGSIRFPNRYRGEIRKRDGDTSQLELRGESWPAVTTHVRFRFEPVSAGTAVEEDLVVSAPAPLLPFVAKTAVEAHRRQLEAVRERFAGAAGARRPA